MDHSQKTKTQLTEELESLYARIAELEHIEAEHEQAEKALARLASFPEQNPNPIIETDLTGQVTYCNPAARERFEDLQTKGFNHPILSGVEPIIAAFQAGERESHTREIDLGGVIYEQKSCYIPGNNLIRIFNYDITERKCTEQLLNRLASFPEQNPNPVIETDLTGQVTYCNPAAKTQFPDLQNKGYEHPLLSGVEPLIIACQIGESESVTTREIQIDGSIYEQKVCCVEQSNLVRIFTYDLTERLRAEALEAENIYLREEMDLELAFGEIVGKSQALKNVLQQIEMVAPTYVSVLIEGESGTGKELIARAIHAHSLRYAKTMVKANCGAIPRELFESEFFGHVKGAFTGAVKDRRGRFELADGGTLFLDEVAEIPLELQSKLLRVLQEGQFERVGDDRTRTVDVRIIAATNRDLKAEVSAGRFREDLFYRLSVFPMTAPPLRDRREDIPLLAHHFIEIVCTRLNRPKVRLTQGHINRLQRYDWPGNIRELQNVIERAIIVSRGGPLRLEFVFPDMLTFGVQNARSDSDKPLPTDADFVTDAEFKRRERENIVAALEHANWKVFGSDGAAALLELKPTTLVSRIKKMEIEKR
jgi:transcriptional regulator with GAF, ATPase, and Fis domain/PAS domain-containing protein